VVADAFDRVGATLDRFESGRYREVLNLGVVGTFASGWLLQRLPNFARAHPEVDLRVMTNNNRTDLATEGLDLAIRFGDGAWHATHAEPLMGAPLTPLCAPGVVERIRSPGDLVRETLFRSYRIDEWPRWFAAAGVSNVPTRATVFDSSVPMVAAAAAGLGVALAPATMFARELTAERLVRPFEVEIETGRYWLTRLHSRSDSAAMAAFREWLTSATADGG
jgi:LysR family transcriptional regulator of beta-lactamase